MMIRCLGISVSFKASVEVMMRSLSTLTKGSLVGLLPVAMIVYLAVISVAVSPSI
jgi:hypothetical protein